MCGFQALLTRTTKNGVSNGRDNISTLIVLDNKTIEFELENITRR